jgi:hypothetical protein
MLSVTEAGRRAAAPSLGTFERYLTLWIVSGKFSKSRRRRMVMVCG